MASLLVGRGVEVAVLRGLIADLPNRSAAVMVRGEAGIGKTVLVRSVLEGHSGDGVRVLRGACAPMSGSTAYSGLDAALGGVVGGAVSAETFPSAAAGRAWAIETLREGLDDRSPEGTVLLVEDVHWADRSTLDFLSYTTRNLPDRRLLVVVTWRDEDGGPEHRSWLAEQLRNPEVVDLTLRRLTLDETAEQLSRLKPVLSGAQVAVVYERSAGNPYLSAELAGGGSAVSRSLRQVLSARLQELSPAARLVVAATGTLARPLTDEDMSAAVGGDSGAVREACDSGLVIRDVARGATARHPVLAEVGYEQLLSAERRGLHARLGTHLEEQLAEDARASSVAEVAEQYRRADDREATLRWSVRAARAAEAAYAPAEAGHWYAVASSVRNLGASPGDEVPGTLELAEMAACLLGGVGQHERAFAVLDGPLAQPDAPDAVVVRALVTRGWLRVAVGDTDGALNDLERAEQLTEPADEPALARVLCERGMALSTCTRDTEAEPVTRRALDIARRLGDRRTICRCQLVLGIIASRQQRYDECRGRLDEVLSLAREIAQPEELALAGLSLTDLHWRLGETDRVVEVVDLVRPELRRLTIERHWLEDLMDGNVVIALYDAGRWDEALAWGADPAEWAGLGFIECPLAQVHVARGDLASARELQEQSVRAEQGDQPQFKQLFAEVQVPLLLLEGRPSDALSVALSAAEVLHDTTIEPGCGNLLMVGLEAAVALGSRDAFERLVNLLRRSLEYSSGTAVQATIQGERSRLLGEPDPAAWRTAAQEWSRLRQPFPEARSRFRAAEAMLGRRDLRAARQQAARELDAAHRTAERLGAAPLLEQILRLAKVARIPLEESAVEHHPDAIPEPSGSVPALTDRERQVLALVADGRTNREIGAALYMSPKTASVHVTHILEKLGVQTRVQAAAATVRLGLEGDREERQR